MSVTSPGPGQKSFVLTSDITMRREWHTFGERFLTFDESLFGIPLYRELEPVEEEGEWRIAVALLQINLKRARDHKVYEQIYIISAQGRDKQEFLKNALDEAIRRWYQ